MAIADDQAAALKMAVESVGGQAAMGRLLGVAQPSVWRWLKDGKSLPPKHVLTVETATGISRHALRPDIYGPEPAVPHAAAHVGDSSLAATR